MNAFVFARTLRLLALLLALALAAVACAGDELAEGDVDPEAPADDDVDVDDDPVDDDAEVDDDADPADPDTIVVGSANFPEALLLGEMAAMVLTDAGLDVETTLNIGSREVYFPAMQQGELDVLIEYTGALLAFLTDGTDETDVDVLMDGLRSELEGEGITVLDPSEAENRNSLVVTPETAEEYDLETVSDLAPVGDELVLGGPPEYRERRIGLPGLEEVYGITFAEFRDLDAGGPLVIEALDAGDIDVGTLFTTQGVIDEQGWIVLEEDEPLIPAENLIPVVRDDALTDDVEAALSELMDALSTEQLTELNRRIEVENEDPDAVAEDWLSEQGLIE